jgi:hypothetical protein
MKKLLFLFFLVLFTNVYAQKGSTLTDTTTTGWALPSAFTPHFKIPIYKLLSNPGGWINKTNYIVDNELYSLDSAISLVANGISYYLNPNDFTVTGGDSVALNKQVVRVTNNSTLSVLPSSGNPFPEPTTNLVLCSNATSVSYNAILSPDLTNGQIITIVNLSSTGSLTFSSSASIVLVSTPFVMNRYASLKLLYVINSSYPSGIFIEIGRTTF